MAQRPESSVRPAQKLDLAAEQKPLVPVAPSEARPTADEQTAQFKLQQARQTAMAGQTKATKARVEASAKMAKASAVNPPAARLARGLGTAAALTGAVILRLPIIRSIVPFAKKVSTGLFATAALFGLRGHSKKVEAREERHDAKILRNQAVLAQTRANQDLTAAQLAQISAVTAQQDASADRMVATSQRTAPVLERPPLSR